VFKELKEDMLELVVVEKGFKHARYAMLGNQDGGCCFIIACCCTVARPPRPR
jgi:hypothetical protein